MSGLSFRITIATGSSTDPALELSQIRQKAVKDGAEGISYENKSNHCCLVTASCLSSLRTMGRIESHLSSNCRDPLFWRRDMSRVAGGRGRSDEGEERVRQRQNTQ